MQLLDLSHPMRPDMHGAGMPPHLNMETNITRTVGSDGMLCVSVTMGTHIGTHLDGAAHLIEGAWRLEDLPLETYYGTGIILDIQRGADEAIGVEDFEAADPAIEHGDIVFVYTGWDVSFGTEEYTRRHPYITDEAAHWLVDRGIKMIGVDMLSPDLPWSLKGDDFRYTTLLTFLEHSVPVLLNLANLQPLAGKRTDIFALPLNFAEIDSGPARVVAAAL